MNSVLTVLQPALLNQVVVAAYLGHVDAEAAVRALEIGGIPMDAISIVGRNFETHRDIQGFYRPADSARSGTKEGTWLGGAFRSLHSGESDYGQLFGQDLEATIHFWFGANEGA